MKKRLTPEQLGLKPEHIVATVRSKRLFSCVVHELCSNNTGELDIERARQCRDALVAGSVMVHMLGLTCALDEESVLKNIEQPVLPSEYSVI